MNNKLVSIAAALAAGLGASTATADVYDHFTVSNAQYDAFPDGSMETVNGTFTLDQTTLKVTALSLTATGTYTMSVAPADVFEVTYTGDGTTNQYEIGTISPQSGHPYYVDFQTSAPAGLIANSLNGYQSNLYDPLGYYSGLTDPGTVLFSSNTPEPATWALMLLGVGAVGGALRRGRRVSLAA